MFDSTFEDILNDLDNSTVANESELTLDDALAALESESIAQEGLFTKVKSVDDLLAKIQKRVDKCKTAEECEDLKAKIGEEIAKFNDAFKTMKKAGEDLKAGTIDKNEFSSIVKPVVKGLKKTCDLLKLGNVVGDEKDITDDDIAKLKAFLEGAQSIIGEKCASFADSADEACGKKGLESLIDDIINEDDIAQEGVVGYSLRTIFSQKRKDAKTAIKDGKSLANHHQYKESIVKYKEAKKLLKDCIDKLNKIPETELSQYRIPMPNGEDKIVSQTSNYCITKALAKSYFVNMIFKCDEAIEKVENKLDKAKANESYVEFEDIDVDDTDFDIDD